MRGIFLFLLGISVYGQCVDEELSFVPFQSGPNCPVDNSQGGYFFLAAEPPSNDFIIWLGDSDLCSSQSECRDFCSFGRDCPESAFDRSQATLSELRNCFFRDLTCSSTNWEREPVCPTTILKDFTNFNRVFIPQCTFDMFLGQQTGSSPFQGFAYFQAVLNDLNLDGNSNIILGGTRLAGIGALNLMSSIEGIIGTAPASLRAIIDSAWLVKAFDFQASSNNADDNGFGILDRLQANTANYLSGAQLDVDCRTAFAPDDLINCLIPSELLEFSPFLQSQTILFVQSQYDATLLGEFGVLDEEAAEEFEDPQTLATNGIKFIEQIGATVRSTLSESTAIPKSGDHVFFSTSCSEHAAIVPINILEIEPREEGLGAAGSVNVTRTDATWELLKVRDTSLQGVVTDFVNNGLSNSELLLDACGSFLCGDSCELESDVTPFIVDLKTSEAVQGFALLVAAVIVSTGWLAFITTYCRVLLFRRIAEKAWRNVRQEDGNNRMRPNEAQLPMIDTAENDAFLAEFAERRSFVSLMVTKCTYLAPPRRAGKEHFTILRDISLCAKAGEVHALMGPSGSGKSTLLDVLSLTRDSGIFRGTHYINGIPSHIGRMKFLRQWLTHHLSYVRQQDVLFPLLTVRQHLTHAAWLMLPESMKASAKVQRVYKVAKLLGLEHVLDTKIGDGGVKIEGGISGGERRRVSVATQLLKMPAALVLDEPTSGLDSANALLLVSVLHKLAHEARVCVLLTIHQPRREIFTMFDRLTILFGGRVTFSGSPTDAAQFFRFRLDEVNIGDDILDKLEDYRNNARQLAAIQRTYQTGALGKRVKARIAKEETYLTKEKAQELKTRLKFNAKRSGRVSWEKATSTWQTTKVLLSRTMYRGGFDIERTALVALFGGVLVGSVFLDNDNYTKSAALAYLIVATMTFLQATFLGTRYQLEKGMWSHEKDAGTTVSWKAFIISLYIRNIVTSTIEGLAFAIPAYIMGKLNTDKPERFPLFIVLLVLVAICVISQNTLVEIDRVRRGGLSGPDLRQAALVNMSLLSIGVLFNGFIIPLDSIPPLLQWVPYLMLTFWGFVGILVNNFRDFEYPCDISVLECATRTGDSFIVEFSYDTIDVYQAILALSGLIIFYHIAGVLDFVIRFVGHKGKLRREEVAGDQRQYTEDERKYGFAGDTMKLLIKHNQPKKRKKKPSRKFSKQVSKAKLRKNHSQAVKEIIIEEHEENRAALFDHPSGFDDVEV